ncbi:hypothetical protein HDU86_004137 [Geranomyces michiganensis]|nr:hypothetical protein HDU86_004137 [Geranomyces michiganensis]
MLASGANTVPLFGIVAAESGGYRVFSVRLASPNVPLADVRLNIASRLGIDPNSPAADLIQVYRIDEDLHNDDERLKPSIARGYDNDPQAVFALTELPETMDPVSQSIPRIANSCLHVLVRLPVTGGGADVSDFYGLPPAYVPTSEAAGSLSPEPPLKGEPSWAIEERSSAADFGFASPKRPMSEPEPHGQTSAHLFEATHTKADGPKSWDKSHDNMSQVAETSLGQASAQSFAVTEAGGPTSWGTSHVDSMSHVAETSPGQASAQSFEVTETDGPKSYDDIMDQVAKTSVAGVGGAVAGSKKNGVLVAPIFAGHKVEAGQHLQPPGAEAPASTARPMNSQRKKWLAAGLLLVLIAIGVIVGVVVAKGKGGSDGSSAPQQSGTTSSSATNAPTATATATSAPKPIPTVILDADATYVGARAFYTAPGCKGQPSSWLIGLNMSLPCFNDGSFDRCVNNVNGTSARSTCNPGLSYPEALIYGDRYSFSYGTKEPKSARVTPDLTHFLLLSI